MDRDTNTEDPTVGMEGYRAPQVCKLAGITYRQLDYWDRTELLQPSLVAAQGSGTLSNAVREYSPSPWGGFNVTSRVNCWTSLRARCRPSSLLLNSNPIPRRPPADLLRPESGHIFP